MFDPAAPRCWSAWAANRIITSGPQMKAIALCGSNGERWTILVTTPTVPCHSIVARSTVTSTTTSKRLRHSRSSFGYSMSRGVRAP